MQIYASQRALSTFAPRREGHPASGIRALSIFAPIRTLGIFAPIRTLGIFAPIRTLGIFAPIRTLGIFDLESAQGLRRPHFCLIYGSAQPERIKIECSLGRVGYGRK